jgi:capsule polysaccharide export protein KpsE/RkpR
MVPIYKTADKVSSPSAHKEIYWVKNIYLFWNHRQMFIYVSALIFVISVVVAYFVLPKRYESVARIMPPEQANSGAAMLAALVGKGASSNGGLAGLAGSLLGAKNNGALFVALLRSGTVSGHLIDRFDLQHVYRNHYRTDTAKRLANVTHITEDAKSGVITIIVTDKSPYRARDLAQGYLDELNNVLAKVNTSSAQREREFIERRLKTVQDELQHAQISLSDFSTKNTTIDIKEQTRAMVDAGAKLQGQLIVGESELDSLRQIYGNENVRVRAAEARNSILRRELTRESEQGSQTAYSVDIEGTHPYPALRQLPQLGVRWANLYRDVRIHETVFDLLSEEYETARIEEAKSIPTVSVFDAPGIPEKKSGPYRVLIILTSTLLSLIMTGIFLLMKRTWLEMSEDDARRVLATHVLRTMQKG